MLITKRFLRFLVDFDKVDSFTLCQGWYISLIVILQIGGFIEDVAYLLHKVGFLGI